MYSYIKYVEGTKKPPRTNKSNQQTDHHKSVSPILLENGLNESSSSPLQLSNGGVNGGGGILVQRPIEGGQAQVNFELESSNSKKKIVL